MTRYAVGANFERQVKAELEAAGWFVVRSAGSHGPVDLALLRRNRAVLIQCKTDNRVSPADRETLASLEEMTDARAVIAHRPKRGVIAYRMLGGHPWTP